MSKHLSLAPLLLVIANAGFAQDQTSPSGSWDKIKSARAINIGYRPDGLPFSYEEGGAKKPVGYAIDICRALVAKLQQSMGLAQLDIKYHAINGQTRFTDLASGVVDVDCSNTTNTKERRETKHVAFSIPYYIAGVRILRECRQVRGEFRTKVRRRGADLDPEGLRASGVVG